MPCLNAFDHCLSAAIRQIVKKIDAGIALCHFIMGMEEQGDKPCLVMDNPGLEVPENAEYIATVKKG